MQFKGVAYRVTSLHKAIHELEQFGLKCIGHLKKDGFREAFLSFNGIEGTIITLFKRYGITSYDQGTMYGHMAFATHDITKTCSNLQSNNISLPRLPGPVKGGSTVIAFAEDLDKKKIELIERNDEWKQPFLHLMIRVSDIDNAIKFYTHVLGMKELRRSDNSECEYTLVFMGYGDEREHTALELTYNWGDHTYTPGSSYCFFTVETSDISATYKQLVEGGADFTSKYVEGESAYFWIKDPCSGGRVMIVKKDHFDNNPEHISLDALAEAEAQEDK